MTLFISTLLQFLMLVYKEFFSAKAKAQQANQAWLLDRTETLRIIQVAMNQMQVNLPIDTAEASSVDDQMDSDLKP